ncbi:hypothetical protein CH063_15744 [Colletotrichum higginsianum]|uniref:Uncharacterized protein n=2 Tax=Colletotrichum higginsianum TaxID=80884 RepID=H1W0C0_COLHI|nr:hypothetical protein CH063_03740 [Colletotrichum higginsianum]CCF47305.1 hypothetical protein CH063_15744 [Colletotrichum higginsianum]
MFFFFSALVTSLSASIIIFKVVMMQNVMIPGTNRAGLSLMDDQDGTTGYSKQVRIFSNESWADPAAQRFDELRKDAVRSSWLEMFPSDWQGIAAQAVNTGNITAPRTQMSMFHQLDCLLSILDTFLDLNRTKRVKPTEYTFKCFSYLHSALLCCSDTALEGSDIYAEAEGRNGTLGIGSAHICKSFSN